MDCSVKFDEISIKTFKKFKDIKAIIFDFDDTLYRNLSWEGYDEFFLKNIRKILPNLTDEEFNNLLKHGGYLPSRPAETFAKILVDKIGTTRPLVEFLKTVKYETDWQNAKVFSSEVLTELSKKYKLYIVSNSSRENIEFVSKKIGLDITSFEKILSNNFEKEDLSKSKVIEDIFKTEKLDANSVLMVGDSKKYDIDPAKKLEMQTLLVY